MLSYALVVLTSPFSLLFVLRRIPQYERAVVLGSTLDTVTIEKGKHWGTKLGEFQACIRGPGLIFVLPFLEKVTWKYIWKYIFIFTILQVRRVDIRTRVLSIPPQQILSTDSVTLTVEAVVYYK